MNTSISNSLSGNDIFPDILIQNDGKMLIDWQGKDGNGFPTSLKIANPLITPETIILEANEIAPHVFEASSKFFDYSSSDPGIMEIKYNSTENFYYFEIYSFGTVTIRVTFDAGSEYRDIHPNVYDEIIFNITNLPGSQAIYVGWGTLAGTATPLFTLGTGVTDSVNITGMTLKRDDVTNAYPGAEIQYETLDPTIVIDDSDKDNVMVSVKRDTNNLPIAIIGTFIDIIVYVEDEAGFRFYNTIVIEIVL
jgi:hypothetical protein